LSVRDWQNPYSRFNTNQQWACQFIFIKDMCGAAMHPLWSAYGDWGVRLGQAGLCCASFQLGCARLFCFCKGSCQDCMFSSVSDW